MHLDNYKKIFGGALPVERIFFHENTNLLGLIWKLRPSCTLSIKTPQNKVCPSFHHMKMAQKQG